MPGTPVVILTGYGNIATAVTAVKLGAVDYLAKPADADDVVKAVQAQNVQAAVGLVGAAPLLDDVGFQLNITTQGRLVTVEEFENIVVRAQSDGALVRIKDIARVELGASPRAATSRAEELERQLIPTYWVAAPRRLSGSSGAHRWVWDLRADAGVFGAVGQGFLDQPVGRFGGGRRQDLERAGGFDRQVLVVTTVTGTGTSGSLIASIRTPWRSTHASSR